MPAWSPEIANVFIRLASAEQRPLDQMQLQKLVYIAHGWCLASFGQPLTGDRPEAWEFGPIYRRLAEALAAFGRAPVTSEIGSGQLYSNHSQRGLALSIQSNLDQKEGDLIARVYQDYGYFQASQLSNLTRRGATPWATIFADGSGKHRDIPHSLIRAQFVKLAAAQSKDRPDRY